MTPLLNETYYWLPSTKLGSELIDQIEVYGVETDTIVQKGRLPIGVGFNSDHREAYTDLDAVLIMGLTPDKGADRVSRRLKSENKEYSKRYVKALTDKL